MKVIAVALSVLAVPLLQDSGETVAPIRGQVVDEDGSPIAGVRYSISGEEILEDGEWYVALTTGRSPIMSTDEQGRFELPGRRGVRYDLDFEFDGMAPVFLTRAEAGADLEVVMRPGLDVSGRVVIDGVVGMSGFQVGLERPNGRGNWFQTSTSTGADGSFEFPGFLAGEGWQLTLGGGVLRVDLMTDDAPDDLLIDVRVSRSGD